VDVCVVILRLDDPSEPDLARIAAVTRAEPPFPVPVNTAGRCAHAAMVFHTRQPVSIEDAQHDAEFQRFGITGFGSALYVPLTGEAREAQGVLALMRRRPGPFDEEQVKLAQIFAARAAAAIHAARLYEQTRKQAETNATLLRELNHRVKNNLAGIVGLLSAGAPNLTPEARQWLDRAVDRIHTMARAHDLFSGGLGGVAVADLVHTTMATVLGTRTVDVRIDAELDGVGEVTLCTDHAVTLAMVLHELAYNALAHALTGGGQLRIRGRRTTADAIAIDVIDEPVTPHSSQSGAAPAWFTGTAAAPSRRGLGLDLVRGLVGRELRGSFTLSAGAAGGTVATVEFRPRDPLPAKHAVSGGALTGSLSSELDYNGNDTENGNGNGRVHHG
jgi:two-component sensor histidine kinase